MIKLSFTGHGLFSDSRMFAKRSLSLITGGLYARRVRTIAAACIACLIATGAIAQSSFSAFLELTWRDAQAAGVSRATFDAAVRDLTPDLTLPDLVIPGRPASTQRGQAEFVQTPEAYLNETSLQRLAARGRALVTEHRDTLARIEREFGVPGSVVLAIWGRETAFGSAKLSYDAVRTLATQAYTGRRKDMFRQEFVYALKMLQDGYPRAQMKSSWGGAMGLTQFIPSEFYKYATDLDGDGRVDIFTSVPDALASAAKQLRGKGWQPGGRWAIEVRVPATLDCTIAEPEQKQPLRAWLAQGYAPVRGAVSAAEQDDEASLLIPEGKYGPAFLTLRNYYVLKEYNFADLYVLFVGNLADRIAGGGAFVTPWAKLSPVRSTAVERLQEGLRDRGLYQGAVDGKAGMKTRSALGAFQKSIGSPVDCWPSETLRARMDASR